MNCTFAFPIWNFYGIDCSLFRISEQSKKNNVMVFEMLKLIFKVPIVFLFVLGVGNRLWEIYDRYSCLEILGPVWAMSRVSNFQSWNINSMVRYNDRTAERIKADFTVGNHGRAKPPLKCCFNAWVVVLYYNNFTKVGLKMKNVRPIKLFASMS